MEISNPFRLGLIGTGRNGHNALVIGFPEWGGRGGGPRVTCGGMGTLWELCNKFRPLVGKMWGLRFKDGPTLGENMGTFAPFST